MSKVMKKIHQKLTQENDTLDIQLKTHLKSSVISLRLAWKGMFLTNIFVLFCFFSVFDFFFLVVAGLKGEKKKKKK